MKAALQWAMLAGALALLNASLTFDNVFHLNAIRYVLDTGAASPLQLGQMTSPSGGVPFYPSAATGTHA